ncbi:50S ribosomal protein L32 [Chloroflexota bacterium]
MPPLPKRKYAKARQGKRRSHLALAIPTMAPCPQCHTPKLPHHVCPFCGSYRGREVLKAKTEKKKG